MTVLEGCDKLTREFSSLGCSSVRTNAEYEALIRAIRCVSGKWMRIGQAAAPQRRVWYTR